jgi:tetratricopeptide (TPR) repeat protein
MDLKDIVSLSVSGLALAVSLTATAITLRQKKFETERTLRHQLTDAIGKLNSAFESASKLEQEKAGTLNEPSTVNLRAFYNGQKLFYARQAVYVASQIPHLVADAEYNSVARAFLDVDDDENALLYYRKAIEAASEPLYKATNLRGLGRTLIRIGKEAEGRSAFSEALDLVPGTSDSSLWFRAETNQRWAQVEAAAGRAAEAKKLLDDAESGYRSIRFPSRRSTGIKNLQAVRNSLFPPPPLPPQPPSVQ